MEKQKQNRQKTAAKQWMPAVWVGEMPPEKLNDFRVLGESRDI